MKKWLVQNNEGVKFHTVVVEPTVKPIGHVHILHGMAEHIARYEEFMNMLASLGYVVSGHDHRGHGFTAKANGAQGHFGDNVTFDQLADDAEHVIAVVRRHYATLPFTLFGHSMGSFIGRRLLQRPFLLHRAIFSGTGADPAVSRFFGTVLAKFRGRFYGLDQQDNLLNKLAFGRHNVRFQPTKTDFDWLSRDEQSVSNYIDDSMCGFVPTTSFFHELFYGIGAIHRQIVHPSIPHYLPILFVSGTDDPVGNYGKGVWRVAKQFKKAKMANVTVLLFEEGRHEMLNEINKQAVYQSIVEWMKKV